MNGLVGLMGGVGIPIPTRCVQSACSICLASAGETEVTPTQTKSQLSDYVHFAVQYSTVAMASCGL